MRETTTTQRHEAATKGRARSLAISGEGRSLGLAHASEACVNPSVKLGFVECLQFAFEEHTAGDDRQHNVGTHRAEDDCSDRVMHRCVVSARKIDGDDVGLFAGFERTDVPIQTQCSVGRCTIAKVTSPMRS